MNLLSVFRPRLHRFALWGLGAYLVAQVGMYFAGPASEWHEAEKRAAAVAGEAAAAEMARRFPDSGRISLSPVLRDPHRAATDAWAEAMRDRDREVKVGLAIQAFASDLLWAAVTSDSPRDLLQAGRRVKLDLVLGGRLTERVHSNGVADVTLQWAALDPRGTNTFQRGSVTGHWPPPGRTATGPKRWPLQWSLALRMFLLALGIGLTVVGTLPLMDRTIEAKSNLASLAFFAALTGIGLGLTVLYLGVTAMPPLGWAIVAGLLSGTLYVVCEKLAALRQ